MHCMRDEGTRTSVAVRSGTLMFCRAVSCKAKGVIGRRRGATPRLDQGMTYVLLGPCAARPWPKIALAFCLSDLLTLACSTGAVTKAACSSARPVERDVEHKGTRQLGLPQRC